MSRGLGRIQRECLRVIEVYLEANGRPPNTFNVTVEVYQIKRDRHGNRTCNDAQHTAVKRALASLRRKGLVTGAQDVRIESDGTKMFPHVRQHNDGSYSRHAERCCFWSIVKGKETTA